MANCHAQTLIRRISLLFHNPRQLVEEVGDLVENLLQQLTRGLSDVASNSFASFDSGPLGPIDGVLDKSNLNFATTLLKDFKSYYDSFKTYLLGVDDELKALMSLKPKYLSRFTALLQIGSLSDQYSSQLKGLLWDKLDVIFPLSMHNKVKIPGFSLVQSFEDAFPFRGDFPVEQFLPLLAVAYGQPTSCSGQNAQLFSMKSLFAPQSGPDLSKKLLSVLTNKSELNGSFDGIDSHTKKPWDSTTKEIFNIFKWLPEIQYAFDLSTSVALTAENFHSSDLYAALYPNAIPSVKSVANFVKAKIIKEITESLDNVFDVGIDISTVGLEIDEDEAMLGGTLSLGNFSDASTQLFPPRVSIDNIQVS